MDSNNSFFPALIAINISFNILPTYNKRKVGRDINAIPTLLLVVLTISVFSSFNRHEPVPYPVVFIANSYRLEMQCVRSMF